MMHIIISLERFKSYDATNMFSASYFKDGPDINMPNDNITNNIQLRNEEVDTKFASRL